MPLTEDETAFAGDARAAVEATLADAAKRDIRDTEVLAKSLHDEVAELVYRRLRRRPMIIAVAIEA